MWAQKRKLETDKVDLKPLFKELGGQGVHGRERGCNAHGGLRYFSSISAVNPMPRRLGAGVSIRARMAS